MRSLYTSTSLHILSKPLAALQNDHRQKNDSDKRRINPVAMTMIDLREKNRRLSEYPEKNFNPQEASKAELELAAPGFQVLHLTNRATALGTASL